jgi:hypothetical protein
MNQLEKVMDVLHPSDIQVPIEVESFWSASFAAHTQNEFRSQYLTDYCGCLLKSIKHYCTSGSITAFLGESNLEILGRKVRAEFELENFPQAPTNIMIKKVLLILLEMK